MVMINDEMTLNDDTDQIYKPKYINRLIAAWLMMK